MFESSDLIILTISVLIIYFFKLWNKKPQPLFGVFQRPNGFYWFKVAFMFVILSLKKLKPFKKDDLDLDRPQKLSSHEKAVDAVYLNGANKNGDHLVVGTARRNNLLVDGFIYLKVNHTKLGVLESMKLPNTSLYKLEESDKYLVDGIKLEPIEPMKIWRFTFHGQMKESNKTENVHDVIIDGIWTKDSPYFHFDKNIDPLCMAKSMAYEKWTRSYFKTLKANHQIHYEQFGTLKATITIKGKTLDPIEFNTVRDHSFGLHREWKQFHSYCLHLFTTENGDHFSLGSICLPISFSRLTVGFVYVKKDDKNYPVQESDLQLYQYGGGAVPPRNYGFVIVAGGKQYAIKVKVIDSPYFYISKSWDAKVYERLCSFEVDGLKGWGASEWQTRNVEGTKVLDYGQ